MSIMDSKEDCNNRKYYQSTSVYTSVLPRKPGTVVIRDLKPDQRIALLGCTAATASGLGLANEPALSTCGNLCFQRALLTVI